MNQEEQVEVLRRLSQNVHEAFTNLRENEQSYLEAIEKHHDAKEVLARAIDSAYDEGNVIGKNEREREAHLRRLLPKEHNEEARLEALMRGAERTFNLWQRDAQRLSLQVEVAKMVYDLQFRMGMGIVWVPRIEGGFQSFGSEEKA